MILVVAVLLPAQEPTLHGYLRHQLGAAMDGGEIIRNVVTAEVELGYQGVDVDVLLNPYFQVDADAEGEVGLREAYIDYYTDSVDFRVGKQIVIWGKADGLAITDVVSPKDLSNFLIPEFRELRLGVIAGSATVYRGAAALEVVYVPVFTPSILPAPDSIWYTSFDAPVEPTITPGMSVEPALENGEVYSRLRLQTGLLDFDLAGGYYWTNEPSPTISREFASPGVLSSVTVTPEYYRQFLAGAAVSASAGPFILRGEAGYFTPRRLLTEDVSNPVGYVEKDYLQALAGADTVVAGVDLSAQVMHQFIVDYEDALQQDEYTWTATLRARRTFFRDRLAVDLFSYIGLNEPDALVKTGATWAPADALSFRLEGNFFFGDTGQFGGYSGNDLIVLSTRYSY
jgi:hypothetical protein